MNKEYRLASWPELAPTFHRTAYRRLLNEMSQRHLSLKQLAESSGLRRPEVKQFLDALEASGQLLVRDVITQPSGFASLKPFKNLGLWLRRTPTPSAQQH